jgi:malic enzyme
MRALLDLKIKKLTEEMLVSVAQGIEGLVDQVHLSEKYIIPKISDLEFFQLLTRLSNWL